MDLANLATQTELDIGLSVVTGGSMAIPAAIRTFGDSAAEARGNGATLDEQMLYATTSAAATYGIEQLCNVAFGGLKSIAPGAADDFLTNAVEKLALKAVGDPVGAQALTNIGMLIASGASEGVEETLESLLQPFLQQLSYDKDAQNVFQNPKLLADAVYEGVIGGMLGMFGSGTNTAVDLVDNLIHNNIMPGEKLMADADVSESEVLGAIVLNDMVTMDEAAGNEYADSEALEFFSIGSRDKLTFIVKRSTIKTQSGFSCFPDGDPLNANIQNVAPMEGYFDAAMHGTPTMVGFVTSEMNMSPRLLASVIRHSEGYRGQNVRLLSCSTGKIVDGEYCFAEELANALGVEVSAPDKDLYISTHGDLRVGKFGEGQFVTYSPNKRRRMR